MIHMILVGQKAGEMSKAVFVMGESLFPPLSLEPDFVETFRIFSKLEVVTNEDRDRFISMLKETGQAFAIRSSGPIMGHSLVSSATHTSFLGRLCKSRLWLRKPFLMRSALHRQRRTRDRRSLLGTGSREQSAKMNENMPATMRWPAAELYPYDDFEIFSFGANE